MSEFPEENMVELAFDVANSEKLSRDDERLLERIQSSPGARAKFDDYLRTISEARAAFDDLTGPGEAAPMPIAVILVSGDTTSRGNISSVSDHFQERGILRLSL